MLCHAFDAAHFGLTNPKAKLIRCLTEEAQMKSFTCYPGLNLSL